MKILERKYQKLLEAQTAQNENLMGHVQELTEKMESREDVIEKLAESGTGARTPVRGVATKVPTLSVFAGKYIERNSRRLRVFYA